MPGIDIDDLYGLPLARFVPERNALAKAMRADGRREEAAAMARLPRPSVSAWVVNQLVRGNREALKSLLDAGDALRAAQEAVIEGRGDGHALRAAAERERMAADELLGAARALAGGGGQALSETIIDRVADTLHAAAFDEDARERVRGGRLERELHHVGLGGLGAGPLAPASPPPTAKSTPGGRKAAAAGKTGSAEKAEAAAARKAARRTEAEAREARRAAKQAEAQARGRAERAARALTRAEERREQAAHALTQADEALAAARVESESAAEALLGARERVPSPRRQR